ncbi:sugar ABC transporter ATP-binding protein [Pseudonocardia kujensis]|uniref:sugar ABC transporter ATP-binding protein n=1 Tax=Pseudonocardia kujensis TaxID=1128675 RepID=UPI001E4FB6E5|nr:sugar ABC transporter ATP-binding protein [Pseudonocardia kujensis]MCE0764914.1 sugar ABC transporter ATP-binding protein [Pseudonocardia kujensis]
MKTEETVLSLQGITKAYGSVHALTDATFELRAGEVMALLGENGAGKSTMVKVLSGLVQPDSGTIQIAGEQRELRSSADAQAAGIAVVQQEYSAVPALTVAENLALGDRTRSWWWSRRTLHAGAREVLDRVGLDHVGPDRVVATLSVAETQLLELARILLRDARILILDEPTAALSDREIARILAVMRDLAVEGRSIVYVTHRLDEVFRLADRATILKDGRSRPPVPVADLTHDSIVSLMLGRRLASMFPDRTPVDDAAQPRVEVRGLRAVGLTAPVDLAIRPGEIVGLTGQLGSGASSLVRALAGTLPVAEGEVLLDGVPVDLRGRSRGIRQRIAYCSDDRKKDGMFPGLPVLANLSSPWLAAVSRGSWIDRRREKEKAADIARAFSFDTRRLTTEIDTLSGGNQQKIVLGRWAGAEPRLFLIEEPTRGVDVGARAEIYTKLRMLADQGASIVVCSSDSTEILGLCDTVLSFYRGRVTRQAAHSDWNEESLMAATLHEGRERAA